MDRDGGGAADYLEGLAERLAKRRANAWTASNSVSARPENNVIQNSPASTRTEPRNRFHDWARGAYRKAMRKQPLAARRMTATAMAVALGDTSAAYAGERNGLRPTSYWSCRS